MNKDFSKIISKARKNKNITQEELATRLNVSRQTVSNWERGIVYPDSKTLKLLCDELNLNLDELNSADVYEVFKVNELVKDKAKKYKCFAFISVAILVLTLLVGFSVVHIVRNSNEFSLYNVSIDSKHFELDNSIFVYTKDKIYFQFGTLTSEYENTDKDTVYNIEIYQQINNKNIPIYESVYSKNLEIMDSYRKSEIFTKRFMNNLSKTYLIIKFYDNNSELRTVTLKLNFNLKFKSNLVTYLSKNDKKLDKNKSSKSNVINENTLKDKGYIYNDDSKKYEKMYDNGKFEYLASSSDLTYYKITNDFKTFINYSIKNNVVLVRIYDIDSNNWLMKFKYYILNESTNCTTGNCDDYQKYIDLILNEYENLIK